ncbi:MAG: hypothetical protein IJP31_01155 [Lachnospiraceae bacterium]|nr:hypothetical protein [Lachnospiraceae bacterium]
MKFYLLEKPEWFTGEMNILNIHGSLNMQDFIQDRMYCMPSRLLMQIRHREYAEYPGILLDPLPLFEKKMWECILRFMDRPIHTHLLLMDQKAGNNREYYCPDFRRVKGSVKITEGKAYLLLEEKRPKHVPAFYLQKEQRIWVMIRLDLLESFMRAGLCDLRLIPIEEEAK